MIPSVTVISREGRTESDILSLAFVEQRQVFLHGEINDETSAEIIVQLEYLDRISSDDITLFINSPGGSVSAGLSVVDCILRLKSPVATVVTGIAASMAAVIASCGTLGKRYITPYAEMMIHQPLGGAVGQATDVELTAKHISRIKNTLYTLLAKKTGNDYLTVSHDCERDCYLNAEESIRYGLVDKIY